MTGTFIFEWDYHLHFTDMFLTMQKYLVLIFFACTGFALSLPAQTNNEFTLIKEIKATPVKDQSLSGTCWSFATTSFIESELIRKGKGAFDLSEMYSVRNAYSAKLVNYIRMQGNLFFTQGGQPHDVMNVIRKYGMVPDTLYSGLLGFQTYFNHMFLDTLLTKIVHTLADISDTGFMKEQMALYNKTCDAYMGTLPKTFVYNGISYTPRAFSDSVLNINPDDYIEITSYTHHPFYTSFCLESRYNWSFGSYLNLPLAEFMQVIDSAIYHGYSVVWNGDDSEPTFDFSRGTATADIYEGKVTQAVRQRTFENTSSRVDHVMHITGIATDRNGKKYYYVKNSWGTENPYEGYMFLSESFVKLKTASVMVYKQAIPKKILKKIKIVLSF
jgi:bleomycin hydrolase